MSGMEESLQVVREFQFPLLKHLCFDDGFYRKYSAYVRMIDFPEPACQVVYEGLQRYRAHSDKVPDVSNLMFCVFQVFHDPDARSHSEYNQIETVNQLGRYLCDGAQLDPDLSGGILLDYLKKVRMWALERTKAGMDLQEYGRRAAEISNLTVDAAEETDYNKGAWNIPDLLLHGEDVKRVPTNLQRVNKAIDRGLGIGELGLIVACAGVGKTNALLNFSTAAVSHSYQAFFWTGELEKVKIKRRFQAISAEIPALVLRRHIGKWSPQYRQRFAAVASYYNSITRNNVPHWQVFERKGTVVTPIQLGGMIRKWQDNVEKAYGNEAFPMAVYLDWLSTNFMQLNPGTGAGKEKDHEVLPLLCYQLREVAKECGVAMWTATQGNREGFRSARLGQDNVAGAFGINHAIDVGFGLTAPDDDKLANQKDDLTDDDFAPLDAQVIRKLSLNTIKNRGGPPRSFDFFQSESLRFFDSLVQLQILRQIGPTLNDITPERKRACG